MIFHSSCSTFVSTCEVEYFQFLSTCLHGIISIVLINYIISRMEVSPMGQEEEISAEETQYVFDNKLGEVIPARAKEKEKNI